MSFGADVSMLRALKLAFLFQLLEQAGFALPICSFVSSSGRSEVETLTVNVDVGAGLALPLAPSCSCQRRPILVTWLITKSGFPQRGQGSSLAVRLFEPQNTDCLTLGFIEQTCVFQFVKARRCNRGNKFLLLPRPFWRIVTWMGSLSRLKCFLFYLKPKSVSETER